MDCQATKLDGLDQALIGISDVWDTSGCQEERFIYSGDLIVWVLMNRDGMSFEDAMEFISINIEPAYVGPNTPIVMWETHGEEE